jgi:hypothetical protein
MLFRHAQTELNLLTGRACLVAYCILYTELASAQAIVGSGGFSIPNGTLICRSIPAGPTDSAAFIFQFVDGIDSARQRLSLVAFDSAGRSVYMLVSAPARTSTGESRTDALAVRFVPKTTGGRVVLPRMLSGQVPMNGSDSATREKLIEEELTQAELGQARTLAEWFWSHRCKGLIDDP